MRTLVLPYEHGSTGYMGLVSPEHNELVTPAMLSWPIRSEVECRFDIAPRVAFPAVLRALVELPSNGLVAHVGLTIKEEQFFTLYTYTEFWPWIRIVYWDESGGTGLFASDDDMPLRVAVRDRPTEYWKRFFVAVLRKNAREARASLVQQQRRVDSFLQWNPVK